MFQDLPKRMGLYPSIIFSLMLGGTPLFFESDSAAKIRGSEVAYTDEDHNKYIKKLKISIRLEKKKIREIRACIAKQKRLETQKRRYKKRQERGRILQLRRQKRQQERQIAQRIRLKSKHYILKEEANVLRSVALHLRQQHAEASQLTQQLAETLRVARQRQEELQQQALAQQAAALGLPQQQGEIARQQEDELHLTQQLAEIVRVAQQRQAELQQQELVQQTAMLQLRQQEGEALHLAQQLAETLHIAQQWEGERQRQELVQEAGILRLHQQQAEILLLVQQLAGTLRIAQQGIEEHQRQGRAFVPQQPEEQSFAPAPAPPLPLLTSQLFVEHPHQERIEKTQDGKRRSQEQVEAEQQIQQGVQKEHQQPDQTLASVHPAVPLSHFEQLITEAKRRKDLRQAAGYQIQEGALQEDRIGSGNEDKGKGKRARSPEIDQQNALLNRLAQIHEANVGTSLEYPEDSSSSLTNSLFVEDRSFGTGTTPISSTGTIRTTPSEGHREQNIGEILYRQLANFPVDQKLILSLDWPTTESLPIPQQQPEAARRQEEAHTIQSDNRGEDGKLKESLKGEEKKEEPRAISTVNKETLQQRLKGAISKKQQARTKKNKKVGI